MIVTLAKNRAISEVWQDFNTVYPFLRIDFYKYLQGKSGTNTRQKLNKSTTLVNAGLRREGEIEIVETMTVHQLEQNFFNQFGLSVMVSRKSGSIWLETTISQNWTLKQQNDHGRELSEPVKKDIQSDLIDCD